MTLRNKFYFALHYRLGHRFRIQSCAKIQRGINKTVIQTKISLFLKIKWRQRHYL
jgi:hypothetical protein